MDFNIGLTYASTADQMRALIQGIKDMLKARAHVDTDSVQVRFPVALCTQYTVSGQDRSEAEIAATFEARLSLSDAAATPGKKPYVIELLDTFS